MQPSRVITVGGALIGLIGALSLSGCAGNDVPRRETGPSAGNQGDAWEMVIVGGPEGSSEAAGFEYARRDEQILTHAGEGYDPADAWPDEGRDRLDDVRFLSLPRNARSVTYIGRGPVIWRAPAYRGWYAW